MIFLKKVLQKDSLLIIFILLIAAFLRLYKIADYMTFLGDEGRDVLVVYNILQGRLTFLGPTASVGSFFMGPIYYYFMAPFLWLFNYNPVGPAVMVALGSLITIILIYYIGKEFFGRLAAFIAAIFYSLSSLVIAYSRSSWNPNLMPLFSLLTMYFLYKGLSRKKFFYIFISGISIGIALQLHYTALFLGLICGIYIALSEIYDKGNWKITIKEILKKYSYFFVGFLVGFSSFLVFEVRHGFPNTVSIVKFILFSGETGQSSKFSFVIWDVFFRLFGRLITHFPPPEQISVNDSIISIDFYLFKIQAHVFYQYFPTLILAIFSFLLLVWQIDKALRNKEVLLQRLMIFLWFTIGIFLFGFYKKSIYDYYFEFLFPVPFLLFGNLLSFLWMKNTKLRIISILVFVLVLLLNIAGIPFRNIPNRQLSQVEKISRFAENKTGGKPFNFALITGGNSDHGYRYFFTLWKHSPTAILNSVIDPKRQSVTDQLLVVCEIPCSPLGNPLWEVAGFGRAEIAGVWDVSVVKVYKLIHYKNTKKSS